MNRGRIEQLDTPCEIYRKPANRFVAGFVGSPEMNFLEGEIVQRHGRRLFRWADAELDLTGCPDAEPLAPGLRLTLGIRPEDLRLRVADAPVSESAPSVGGVVEVTENLGERALTHCVIAGSRVRALIPAEAAPRPSTPVSVQFALDKSHWFDPEGVRRSYP
jgi:multiple sugar transport system ATP-binding protein